MNIRVGIMTAPHIEAQPIEGGFLLKNVRIGIGFHWDRHEDQTFQGQLHILHHPDGTQTAVNELDIEDYLCSVISSEMNSHSPMELLKAHAVISRSWAMRAIQANRETSLSTRYESNGHIGFDVCADDHCQRYEGTHRIAERAVHGMTDRYAIPVSINAAAEGQNDSLPAGRIQTSPIYSRSIVRIVLLMISRFCKPFSMIMTWRLAISTIGR